ncbi:nitroreductase family protein [Saccharopolyspora erythraea NRRL 2338]|uniref:Uncharacterized protein n=2 Tax=Saccharopolyspora erythraea TaxID=1836 RepID=A4FIB2_SACEN|nr:nitroreductase family protein [Saccharopolyspora erythraea]PFG97465.1 nitroreductase family protein [Saccharopolyspora erythraea NRRL 2338]QRK87644.1 nitroreductase family protein [Saccharopolyspora erythraea]CAM03787.1 hypothetical protein SACE_4518 [Saccharopolyspora erythraea NRRL 2338]
MSSFPSALGLSPQQTEDVVRMAAAAPSLHNSQPWRFRLSRHSIELHGDPRRRLPAADPADRELRLACGAALMNLRLALAHAGVRPVVTLLPRLAGPSALAEVRVQGHGAAAPADEMLYRAIPARRSNRRPFMDTAVPAGHRHQLEKAVHDEHCRLHVIGRHERSGLERLVQRAHREQMNDPAFREELARWTGVRQGAAEGVPAASAGPEPEPQDQWVVRDFSGGQARQRVPGKDFEDEPLLVVLCSYRAGKIADLEAGQALQRMLLTATSLGLSTSLLSQVVEVDQAHAELRRLLGEGLWPQAVVRVGYGSPMPRTPRREPWELVMDAGSPVNSPD